jgi:hypothetical protein
MTANDRFERSLPELLAELGRADATDLVAEVVSTTSAMRQRPGWSSVEWWVPDRVGRRPVPWRKLALVATVVALATVGIVAVGTALQTPPQPRPTPNQVLPSEPSPGPTLANGASVWDAIYIRPDPDEATMLDVVVVRPDGRERLLRRIGLDLAGSEFQLSSFGTVSEHGWLALSTTSSGQLPVAAYGLFDLGDPARAPLTVPYPPVIAGRWSRNDLFALSSARDHTPTGWMQIDVVDPGSGATTGLGRMSLFGGGPSIVWARDGSGILDAKQIRPVGGGVDIPVEPTTRFLDRRVGAGGATVEVCAATDVGDVCPTGLAIRVFSLSGDAVEWYTARLNPNDEPANAIFAADGRSLLVTFLRRTDQGRQAVVVRMDAPDRRVELGAVDIAAEGWNPSIGLIDPDDTTFPIEYSTGPTQGPVDFHEGPVLHMDGTVTAAPSGRLAGYVDGRVAESWPAVGDFGPPVPATTP